MLSSKLQLLLVVTLGVIAPRAAAAKDNPVDTFFAKLECAALALRLQRFDDETRYLDSASLDLEVFLEMIAEGGDAGRQVSVLFTDGSYIKSHDYVLGYQYAEVSSSVDGDIRGDVPSDQWRRGSAYLVKAKQLFEDKQCGDIQ